jgi:broad specificity phosphatase PhoE
MSQDTNDPELSPAGRERAERLAKFARKYKPHEIFATNYKRVVQTVEPIAKRRGKQVQIYDPRKLAELVQQIMASKTEHYLIAGHSNTIPPLVNLLAKKDVFKNLVEDEFGVIYVVKIRGGQFKRIEVYEY